MYLNSLSYSKLSLGASGISKSLANIQHTSRIAALESGEPIQRILLYHSKWKIVRVEQKKQKPVTVLLETRNYRIYRVLVRRRLLPAGTTDAGTGASWLNEAFVFRLLRVGRGRFVTLLR